jgi:catechol 2,3-dioxygenase-like lactoylglutathione lyase family enzyme
VTSTAPSPSTSRSSGRSPSRRISASRAIAARRRSFYLRFGEQNLGLRPADGGEHTYYAVGIEHLAFEVERREEVDEAFERCRQLGARIHYPPEEDRDLDDYYAFFVFDPDGFRIEVFCAKAAGSAESRWTPKQP